MAKHWLLMTASLFVLAGCGPKYRVEFQNESMITYRYDQTRTSITTVQHHAQEYCAKYGKDAVAQTLFFGDSGTDISFKCTMRGLPLDS